jgi:hypothetical protein
VSACHDFLRSPLLSNSRPEIFRQIGIPGSKTLQYQGISSIIALIAQFCCILFIDWTGRRWAMIGGNLGNCLTFIIATILLAQFPPGSSDNQAASWGFIVVTWAYNFSFSATNGPLSCRSTFISGCCGKLTSTQGSCLQRYSTLERDQRSVCCNQI